MEKQSIVSDFVKGASLSLFFDAFHAGEYLQSKIQETPQDKILYQNAVANLEAGEPTVGWAEANAVFKKQAAKKKLSMAEGFLAASAVGFGIAFAVKKSGRKKQEPSPS